MHGSWLALERFFAEQLRCPIQTKLGTAVARILTLTVVCLGWIVFRSATLHSAMIMLGDLRDFTWNPQFFPILIFIAVLGGVVIASDLLLEQRDAQYLFQDMPGFGIAFAAVLMLVISLYGALNSNAFIYFRF